MNILDIWKSELTERKETFVIPDGCRDVIMVQKQNDKPYVYLSPLYNQTIKVDIEPHTLMVGFRLQPGCEVQRMDNISLLSSGGSIGELTDQIESYTYTDSNVSEALACIRHHGKNIQFCAKELGVSTRTLQRLISTHTSNSPSFWLRLSRARQCAKELIINGPNTEIAYQFNYSDQAHMCREIKKWFGVTPSQLIKRDDLTKQFFWQAY